jgi:hypothetical protein
MTLAQSDAWKRIGELHSKRFGSNVGKTSCP